MDTEYGYAGTVLRVDLSSGRIGRTPTSSYVERFVGGRGLAAKIYWDLVPPEVRAFDPENRLIFVTGPLAGIGGFSGSRWQVCTKSPSVPEHFAYCNLGGHWGAQLKFAGYDSLVVEGASEKPVYLVIRDAEVEIRDASHLWLKTPRQVRETIKGELGRETRVVATGPAGDNRVVYANLLADGDASGTIGSGAVMGSKRLKAIAVRGTGRVRAADPEGLHSLRDYVRALKRVPPEDLERIAPKGSRWKRAACFGCVGATTCTRVTYRAEDGTIGKYTCNAPLFYSVRAHRYYGKETEVPFFAARLCDDLGLDNMVVEMAVRWLVRCAHAGVLSDDNTGLPLSRMGSLEFIETLTRQIAFREGFGDVLANGLTKAAEHVGQGAGDMLSDYIFKGDQPAYYNPRYFITTGLIYALEPRMPMQQLHEIGTAMRQWARWHDGDETAYLSTDLLRRIARRFWGGEAAVDFSTYEGKALAAKKIQDRQYAKESLILCDRVWPILHVKCSEDHLGDSTVESRIFSAVTGRETDEEGLYRLGERVMNLQRAVLAREGDRGRDSDRLNETWFATPLREEVDNPDCWAPGRDGAPFQKRGSVVDRDKFEQLKTEYYELRGWDPGSGLQSVAKLRELSMEEIAAELIKVGAAVQGT